MDQIVEHDTAPAAIEATLNYIENNGEKIFTYTGGPGSSEKRSGGTKDPRRVVIHNGRPLRRPFCIGARRLSLHPARHQSRRFLR
jgi:ribosome biogenesis protein Nip4